MSKVKTEIEFIESIRSIDEKLNNLRISEIQVDKKDRCITFTFVTDRTIEQELKDKIAKRVSEITSNVFNSVKVYVKKMVAETELVNNEIFKFFNANYPSISIFLKNSDISSGVYADIVKYVLRVTIDQEDYIKTNDILIKLNGHLSKRFCTDFRGALEIKEPEETISLLNDEVYESELQRVEYRTIKVLDPLIIDDAHLGNVAEYIEDATTGDVIICGKITEITEKTTKNDKPFFIIHIDDTTAKTSGVYFSKKTTLNKIRGLQVGDDIIAKATIAEYKGKPSLTFQKINKCTFPTDFVKKDRYKKPTPKNYKLIFPSPAKTIQVTNVFDEEEILPLDLLRKTFVVFDLETTGTEPMKCGITEIGAVKVVNGEVKEQFTTLVKPDYPISEKIVELTGITEEMVKDAPKITSVLPDFIKFIEGSNLVAHNSNFDMSFITRFAKAEDYEINNEVIDTLALARKCLPNLRNHDLHTLADYYDIKFQHHRALADAYATAEIFKKLMILNNKK
ncbi:MAG: 3'-5' exoribonuclease [Clostridia bacterium]|nr:3'-5' exoribonuclease [Clostridia bacterium]